MQYRVWLMCICMGVMQAGFAMMAAISDHELVATSDAILVGTVTAGTQPETGGDWPRGKAVVRVDRVIKGTLPATVTVIHTVPPAGRLIMDHGGFLLQAGQQNLFFLVRQAGGFTITGGPMGVKAPEDAARFSTLAGAIPVSVSLRTPVGPFAFGQPAVVTLLVKNRGTEPVQIMHQRLESNFFAPRMGLVSFQVVPDRANGPMALGTLNMETPVSPKVAPGQEVTVSVRVSLPQPSSWALFPADSYLQTPLAVRARVFVQPQPLNVEKPPAGYYLASEWVTTMAGFPLPEVGK